MKEPRTEMSGGIQPVSLSARFQRVIVGLGMERLEHPLFYCAPVGLRFAIGGAGPIYWDADLSMPDPAYVNGALERALAIYEGLPEPPDLLRIDGYPEEDMNDIDVLLAELCGRTGLPAPHERVVIRLSGEIDQAAGDAAPFRQVQFYWDLSKLEFQYKKLLKEIILGDIGGWPGFVSSVYLTEKGPILYHLYDDRGLDVLGGTRELLLPLYCRFNSWILDYDREKIDRLFASHKGLPNHDTSE